MGGMMFFAVGVAGDGGGFVGGGCGCTMCRLWRRTFCVVVGVVGVMWLRRMVIVFFLLANSQCW